VMNAADGTGFTRLLPHGDPGGTLLDRDGCALAGLTPTEQAHAGRRPPDRSDGQLS